MVPCHLLPITALKGSRNGPRSYGQCLLGDYFRESYAVSTPLTLKRTQESFLTPNQDCNVSTKRAGISYMQLGHTLAWLSPHSWKDWAGEWLQRMSTHLSLTTLMLGACVIEDSHDKCIRNVRLWACSVWPRRVMWQIVMKGLTKKVRGVRYRR